MKFLEINNVSHSFDDKPVLNNVSLSLDQGNILCLLGPSGCGKTTLLRFIAGLQHADEGQILLNGKDFTAMPTHKRNFGMMFQELALFPHKNVYDNIAFGLQIQKIPKKEIKTRVEEMLSVVELEGYASRSISTLSGGQCQRVALARSLAPRPQLLMLDEPLGSLDASLRERLIQDLQNIIKKVGVTSIFVTHDRKEAFAIADEIAIVDNEKIQQIDSPPNIHQNPANEEVARFLGLQNLLKGEIVETGLVQTDIGTLKTSTKNSDNGEVIVLLRPEAAKQESGDNVIEGTVKQFIFQGKNYKLIMQTANQQELSFDLPINSPKLEIGEMVELNLDQEGVMLLTSSE